ncbi:triokinase/FMN cyclase-like [Vespa crabro]|uniref:triokinase/FMN cyclase-like n=1 Tax=Vespa crabro TaxID=7445 RepID=UPI001F02D18B|nr:triokinase/FMN cyclase-like [Vespa crabro]
MQHLWNDLDQATETNLISIALIHHGLVLLEDCKAILRRDYSNMTDKVKLISGGGSGNEPAHTGFVGPGMLTAAICGDISSAPPVNSILRVIDEIGTNHSPGVLLIVQSYPGYRINFGLAKLRAESMGIYVKMIIVGDDVCLEADEKSIEKRGLAGILFINKIAGAMAENGENLETICNVCNRIINNEEIATISIGMKISFSYKDNLCSRNSSVAKMEIGYGINGESGICQVNATSIEDIVTLIVHKLVVSSQNSDETTNVRRFPVGHSVAVIVNNLGGTNQIECNIFTLEVLKQLKVLDLLVQRVYTGHLMTSLDSYGFQVSLLNLSVDSNLIKYLDSLTLAPAWPKVLTAEMVGFEQTHDSETVVPTKYCREYCNDSLPSIEAKGAMIDNRTGQVLLIIISFACEALIVCAEQLNIMDKECGDGDCGTTLARGANAIKTAIKENKINSTNPFVTFTNISCIIEKEMGGLQGGLYSLFFHAIAKVFAETNDQVIPRTWLNALIAGNKVISEFGKVSFGDRTMLDPLMSAQNMLSNALDAKMHPIQAFGEAVKAAEKCAIQTIYTCVRKTSLMKFKKFKYPDPGAHAIGIWMRAAYEGVKLKLVCQCEL